jgi:hypothetical protein
MTIHDPAFAPLAAGAPPTPASGLPLLLGTTNAFFLKVGPPLSKQAAQGAMRKDVL